MTALAAYLKEMRDQRGRSQVEVSHQAGLSETYYGKIELGQRRPSVGVLTQICAALSCTDDERVRAMVLLGQTMVPDTMLDLLIAERLRSGALLDATRRKRPIQNQPHPRRRRPGRTLVLWLVAGFLGLTSGGAAWADNAQADSSMFSPDWRYSVKLWLRRWWRASAPLAYLPS